MWSMMKKTFLKEPLNWFKSKLDSVKKKGSVNMKTEQQKLFNLKNKRWNYFPGSGRQKQAIFSTHNWIPGGAEKDGAENT